MKIFFSGDLFLGGELLNKNCTNIIKSDLYKEADIRVVNLEQAVSDSEFVENKCTLYTGTQSLLQLREMKFDIINLAHNHIQDKGIHGIVETSLNLKKAGFKTFGAGKNIEDASSSVELAENLVVLGYCDFGKPYLNQIVVAGENTPGINPLRYEKICSDLDKLDKGKKAILYFHWGREHVWLPPAHDIILVKKLLEDQRVVSIIGMHCHRVQGVINHNGKKAYMSLGNFLFPNFYIQSPTQIAYPTESERKDVRYITRQYHRVYELTYKKWRFVNRVSMVLLLDSETHKIKSELIIQDDDIPAIYKLNKVLNIFFVIWVFLLSQIYKLPMPIYKFIYQLHAKRVYFFWRIQIRFFHIRQLGLKRILTKVRSKIMGAK
ncbi:CapA family protein [Acinetobacter sp. YH12116]|uniref:CapA family protein n=1 Tax=Acinetobacter sp. YH12116 TaxID=2601103 RepID=UPI0015D43164|nr:CapA family protein [Acinetobacter sp. YH12116]